MGNTFLLLALTALLTSFSPAFGEEFHLYYLGGQSNMDGYGFVRDLPDELKESFTSTYIFHGNTSKDTKPVDGRGVWSKLQPGHGVGFQSDGNENKYTERFGVELTFAKAILAAKPKQRIAIIKYSRGGTSIAEEAAGGFGCWEPDFQKGEGKGKGINQYDHFLATIRHATAVGDIDGDGTQDKLIPAGILWMQGESDASYGPEVAAKYEANLKRLMDLIRAALRVDDLPVVVGRISDSGRDKDDGKVWDHGSEVRAAQAAFVENDVAAAIVNSTDEYGYSDPWHYDSAGYIDLGEKFAEAMLGVKPQNETQ